MDGSPYESVKKLPGNSLLLILCPLNYHQHFSTTTAWSSLGLLPMCADTPIITPTELNFPVLGH